MYNGGLGFPGHKKPALQYHLSALAVLVRYNQAQKCLQYITLNASNRLQQFF